MKFLPSLLAAALCAVATPSAAAEYAVKSGDTLTRISRETGFTVYQLALMNELPNPNRIRAGQRITYISDSDVADAIKWCEQRLRELPASDQNAVHFAYTVRDLQQRRLRYSIMEPDGTHFTSVLVFAAAWRDHYGS